MCADFACTDFSKVYLCQKCAQILVVLLPQHQLVLFIFLCVKQFFFTVSSFLNKMIESSELLYHF